MRLVCSYFMFSFPILHSMFPFHTHGGSVYISDHCMDYIVNNLIWFVPVLLRSTILFHCKNAGDYLLFHHVLDTS